MKTAYCLDCNESIQVDDNYQVGDVIECSNCESEFEISVVEPLEITWYYDDDWDDDDDDNWDSDEWEDEESENWSWMVAKHKRINTAANTSNTKYLNEKREDGSPKRKMSHRRGRVDFLNW